MEGLNARLKINLQNRELEVEGSEAFVREYAQKFETLFSTLTQPPRTPAGGHDAPGELPSAFGEYYKQFPNTITDTDRMLLAGYFAQSQTEDNTFTTKAAHDLLKEFVKLSSASTFLKRSIEAKRVMELGNRKFRVSQPGVQYLETLKSQS